MLKEGRPGGVGLRVGGGWRGWTGASAGEDGGGFRWEAGSGDGGRSDVENDLRLRPEARARRVAAEDCATIDSGRKVAREDCSVIG